jgi:hypothetical protein
VGGDDAGALPLHPTKNLFEKRFLELPKLKKYITQWFFNYFFEDS